jgi:L-threonylcarbamoyladenylate synthase
MEVSKLSDNNQDKVINEAIKTLENGGIIIYPTETCYGIGVDATNEEAVLKLLKYKTFRGDKPISIAVANKKMAEEYVELNPTANHLYKEYLPGPFTIVSKGLKKVSVGVESATGTLGVRIPAHDFILKLISKFKKPITATSANVSYKKTPYEIQDILDNTSDKQKEIIDLIIDAGRLPKNNPSTVIDTTLDDVNILRQGDIIIKEKHKVITKSEEETKEVGQRIVRALIKEKETRPIIIAMQGELGTGKTQMTKGIAKEIGIKQEVISPTFIICREYKDCKYFERFHHIDTYKLLEAEEIYEMGFKNMIKKKNLIIIEWAEKISKVIKENSDKARIIWINMYHKNENERIIEYGEYKNEN